MMECTQRALVALRTMQSVRDSTMGGLPIHKAMHALLGISPADSNIARALQDETVWPWSMRRQVEQFIADPANYGYLPVLVGAIDSGRLLEQAQSYAMADHASRISEVHLAKAIVSVGGGMLPRLGIIPEALVQRVQDLEGRGEENLCFVLMPFQAEVEQVYTVGIRPAVEEVGLLCQRADEIARPGVILDQIDQAIEQARVIIADLTDLNPNVMQEVGFARRHKKPIIFLTQTRPSSLRFDVRHYRVCGYQLAEAGLQRLHESLVKALREVLGNPYETTAGMEPLQLPQDWVLKNIQPKLEADGYEVIYPTHDRADLYRLQGWKDVRWKDEHGRLRKIRTNEHTPLLRQRGHADPA